MWNQCGEDRHFEIFIRPDLCESKDLLPMQVATILAPFLKRNQASATVFFRASLSLPKIVNRLR